MDDGAHYFVLYVRKRGPLSGDIDRALEACGLTLLREWRESRDDVRYTWRAYLIEKE